MKHKIEQGKILDVGYKQKMNSIEAVRDAIETLSTDEKIDEGQYLALMNHLKKVYEQIERSERKEDIPILNTGAYRAMALWEQQEETGLNDITLQLSKISLWGGQYPLRRNETNVTAIRIICDGIRNPDTFHQQGLEEVPKHILTLLCDMKWERWASPEVREIFLSNYVVRRRIIKLNSRLKKDDVTVPRFYRGVNTDADGWTRLLHANSILPFKTLKKMNRQGEVVDRNPADIKKLHPITLRFNIPNHPVEDLHLYTNRIQLGRSHINPLLCELLISLIHQEGWTDVPMEYLIKARQMDSNTITTPKMIVSGITATTREKHRFYTCCNSMITITYDKTYDSNLY